MGAVVFDNALARSATQGNKTTIRVSPSAEIGDTGQSAGGVLTEGITLQSGLWDLSSPSCTTLLSGRFTSEKWLTLFASHT